MKWLEIVPFAGFILLILLIAGRIIFLKKKGIAVSDSNKTSGWKTVLLYLLFLLILSVWIIELAQPLFYFTFSVLPETIKQPVFDSLFFDMTGTGIVLAALILMALSLAHFKNSLRFGLNEYNHGKLITRGIFSISRNPFFLSIILYFLGTALVFMNWFFIGFALLAAISIHFFILKEEKFMKQHYGESYRKYRQRVRRYF